MKLFGENKLAKKAFNDFNQLFWIGTNGIWPPYISGIWLSSISSSNVDFSFLFSTNTICKKVQHSKYAPTTSHTYVICIINLKCHLFLGIFINERVNHFPNFHKHIRCMYNNHLPQSFRVAILQSETWGLHVSCFQLNTQKTYAQDLWREMVNVCRETYTCKMDRALRYPRRSLFAYAHPLMSAMARNFSCPGGILTC